jgi:hypothetical protein
MSCEHYWTVSSPCPKCLEDDIERARNLLRGVMKLLGCEDPQGESLVSDAEHLRRLVDARSQERGVLHAEVSALRALLRLFCVAQYEDKFMCRFCKQRRDRDSDIKHEEGCPTVER